MLELAKQFIGKECMIYMFSGTQIWGLLEAISGNALLIRTDKAAEVINLDFVVRIREEPRGKKGKKKTPPKRRFNQAKSFRAILSFFLPDTVAYL